MAVFFTNLLDGFQHPDFLNRVQKKFHYGEEQFEMLLHVAERMLPLIQKDAFWEKGAVYRREKEQACADAVYENVVMSLGESLDHLQEDYYQKEMLLESYMLETLASELLLESYSAYNQHVKMNGKWHVARYHFLGSEKAFPLEMLPGMLKELTTKITCNEAFCMLPKKSVAFVAELTQNEAVHCGGICAGCGSVDCPNRVEEDLIRGQEMVKATDISLNYGYSRIWGNKKQY